MTVATEERISLQEAAKLLGVHEKTVKSYGKSGLHGVRLEHIPRWGNWETSREAVQRFLDAIAVKPDQSEADSSGPTHEQQRAQFRANIASRKAHASQKDAQ